MTATGRGPLAAPPKITEVEAHGVEPIPDAERGQFIGPLGDLANGIDLSIPLGIGLAAVLYPALLWAFPEPADAFGPDGPRGVPAGPAASIPIVSMDADDSAVPASA